MPFIDNCAIVWCVLVVCCFETESAVRTCAVSYARRQACGSSVITRTQCERRDCCFDEEPADESMKCYRKDSISLQCQETRLRCGFFFCPTRELCELWGCCWNDDKAACFYPSIYKCASPPTTEAGIYSPVKTYYDPAETVTYSCPYQIQDDPVLTCLNDGTWSREAAPTCNNTNVCPVPPTVPNMEGFTPSDGPYTPNSNNVVTYTCSNGYQLIGSGTIICENNGAWTANPQCNLVECCPPPSIDRGSFTPVNDAYSRTSQVTYSCDDGSTPTGTIINTCQNDGSWSLTGASLPSCPSYFPKTCNDSNLLRTGTYLISPQPDLLQPFYVYCNFSTGEAITTIEHDVIGEESVSKCEPAYCHKRRVNYDASINQIVALINASDHCRQFIKYRCDSSIMLNNGSGYAAWVSRDNETMLYWGGATSQRNGYCACGETASCDHPGTLCNCDKNTGRLTVDEGYLTDKTKLPVTQVMFGDARDSGEFGWYSLGPLECMGGA